MIGPEYIKDKVNDECEMRENNQSDQCRPLYVTPGLDCIKASKSRKCCTTKEG